MNQHLRIIGAIALKDIADAVKNRIILSIMLGVLTLMLSGAALPLLMQMKDIPTAVIYDPAKSVLFKALTTRSDLNLWLVDSQAEMEAAVGGAPSLRLGLVIPPDFRAARAAGEVVDIVGYLPHWADPDAAAGLVAFFETQLSQASWQTVRIRADQTAYPALDEFSQPWLTSLSLAVALLTIGLAVVPQLFLEEKESHTFEALLASPARFGQIVAGKALAGMVYCLAAALIVFLFNARLFVHWDIALPAIFLGAAFAVALGLLMGIVFDDAASAGLWVGAAMLLLLVPSFLEQVHRLPPLVRALIPWIPSAALAKLLTFSMVDAAPAGQLAQSAAGLLGTTALLYALVAWRVQRRETR